MSEDFGRPLIYADQIKTLKGIKPYLCDLAYDDYRKELYPDMCRNCEWKCGYGKRMLKLLEGEKNNGKQKKRKAG